MCSVGIDEDDFTAKVEVYVNNVVTNFPASDIMPQNILNELLTDPICLMVIKYSVL